MGTEVGGHSEMHLASFQGPLRVSASGSTPAQPPTEVGVLGCSPKESGAVFPLIIALVAHFQISMNGALSC